MAFTKVTKDMGIIAALADKPNDVGGLTAAQLKAKFDEAGEALKLYLNGTLTAELEAAGGAGNIGIQAITGLTATTVQGALEALLDAIEDATAGVLLDGSVTTAKLYAQAEDQGEEVRVLQTGPEEPGRGHQRERGAAVAGLCPHGL